jgi:serine phosphatase RsbU (regulator of sigma subunit)
VLAGEIHVAQQIQRALVPASLRTHPGLKIDAAFRPAQEVGGDFYGVRILLGGVQRILIGDVSGKGAAAAMTGAVLLGASEGHEADSPSALLNHLNRTLSNIGLSGFATCLCLDIDSNGQVRYANAGHIAPYQAGAECPSEPGLPLGLTLGSIYAETSLQLAPGDSLTLLTDGVVEATNPITRELFGFDRTAAISTHSAEEIAAAAQAFGQEDDITVLTLTFAPVEVLLA